MVQPWLCRNFSWSWDHRPLLMGVVNVTPDSFSDGGQFFQTKQAIDQAYRLFEEGADLVDIGGESSRSGAVPVSIDEELKRVLPVVEEIAGAGKLPVSVDTVKFEVAERSLEAGASVINDISGLQRESRLAELAARTGAGLILMHMRGTPQNMQSLVDYTDLCAEIQQFFQTQVAVARRSGVRDAQIVLDPGIGFSKTAEQNLVLIKHMSRVRLEQFPLLVGVSRKSFIGKITGRDAKERLFGTAAAVAASVFNGANILRVHDVIPMKEVVSVAHAISTA